MRSTTGNFVIFNGFGFVPYLYFFFGMWVSQRKLPLPSHVSTQIHAHMHALARSGLTRIIEFFCKYLVMFPLEKALLIIGEK